MEIDGSKYNLVPGRCDFNSMEPDWNPVFMCVLIKHTALLSQSSIRDTLLLA